MLMIVNLYRQNALRLHLFVDLSEIMCEYTMLSLRTKSMYHSSITKVIQETISRGIMMTQMATIALGSY